MLSTEHTTGAAVVGVGVDIADVTRFERLAARGDGRMWTHWYTESEAQQCRAHRQPGQAAAVRFAVKEAAYKAVGAQFSGAVRWADVEVLGKEPDWRVVLHGEVAAAALAAGAAHLHVSTCVVAGRVMATVIAEGCANAEVPAPEHPYSSDMDHHRGRR